jgi:hypothetical protein
MRNKYTKELLEPLVKQAKNWAEVCRSLNVTPATGAQTYVKSVCIKFNIDFSHFLGKGSNKGKVFGQLKPITYYLVLGDSPTKSNFIRKRLIKEGLKKDKCEWCLNTEWLGQPISLELDHINSNICDNRLENLQILCPNCHALKTLKNKKKSLAGGMHTQ